VLLVPAIQMRHELVSDEAARLVFEQDKVFRHPARTRKLKNIHLESPAAGGRTLPFDNKAAG
jgi:hypothetical protein